MRVCVYAIAKNEAANLAAWYACANDADDVVLVDTGSTDGTERGATARISIVPWRFDDARNAALALVPGDVDVCIALDLDERLSSGWRDALEKAWVPGTTKAYYPYIWRRQSDGTPEMFFNHRIHARHGYRWKHPTHEHIYPSLTRIEQTVVIHDLLIEQTQDANKPRPNDLNLLAWGEYESPNDTRMLHYYGRELMWRGYHAEAIERFERYLELEPQNPFPDERAQTEAFLRLCRARVSNSDHVEATA